MSGGDKYHGKEDSRGEGRGCRGWVGVLKRMIRAGFTEKVSFEQRLEGGEIVLEQSKQGAEHSRKGNRRYQGPEAGICPACWRNDEEAGRAGAQ